MKYCIPLLALVLTCADAFPQVPSSSRAVGTATQARSAVASSSSIPRGPLGSIPFGVKYNDTEGGRRIHPYDREDLCIQVTNTTLVEGAVIKVDRCLNNSAPLPAQRNLFNLTTLNITANYTGLIAPANQTTLCLSGQWHIPQNRTDYAKEAQQRITLEKCNNTDPHQIWRYGLDSRTNLTDADGQGRVYKLSLNNETQCATILRTTSVGVPRLVFRMLPCYKGVQSQLLMVVNGTSTPSGRIPNIPLIT